MTLQWVSAQMTTGAILGDLAGFEPEWPLRRSLSNYDTAQGVFHLSDAPDDWPNLLYPGGVVLACYDDADPVRAILWAGYVTRVDPDTSTDSVEVSLTTIEGYLWRRYAGDVQYLVAGGWHRDAIVADLISRYIVTVGGLPGVPLAVSVIGGGGPLITEDLTWQNTDNAFVGDRVASLQSQYGGEFTVDWAWSTDGTAIIPTLRVGTKVATVTATGLPAVTFEQPGAVVSVNLPTDYSDGQGANHVTAYSTGAGSAAPISSPVIAASFAGRPVFEYRYSPVASETSQAALNAHAAQAFSVLNPGARPLALVLANETLTEGQRFGSDWRLGDDVGYVVQVSPAFPAGLSGVARTIAVEIDQAQTTPMFAQSEVYTEGT